VIKGRDILFLGLMAGCSSLLYYGPVRANEIQPGQPQQAQQPQDAPAEKKAASNNGGTQGKLVVTVGKSLIIDSPLDIRRLSVANGDLAEAVAVNPKEVLINGKAPGETSLIVWQQSGARLVYDLTVRMSSQRLDSVRQQIARDFPQDDVNVTFDNDTAFVRGTVKDMIAAERIMSMVASLGKSVNLLRVNVPPVEPQIALKVRFANVNRSASIDLGVNLFNGSFNQQTSLGTGAALVADEKGKITPSSVANILLLRPDLNLAAAIQALQGKRILELLAEPDLMAISGQQASFLAGGEFPFPMVQPGQGNSAISIMWREYGVRLNFMPTVTSRGTIRLKVAPEVSSLDYTNSVSVQGVTVPGMATRRVQTEVELESGQSFVIAGLLDSQVTDSLSKVPGISNIPILGKLFQTKSTTRNNSELLVIITPEIVRPIPAGQKAPELKFPLSFMPTNSGIPMAHPGMDKTGPVPPTTPVESVPFEQLRDKQSVPPPPAAPQMFQMVPAAPAPQGSPGISGNAGPVK
jgi:pilus assembly protein CpaC